MKVSCDIIRDVLPLYAEDMASNATRDMVDEHLCGCDDCVKVLGVIKKSMMIPMEDSTGTLGKVKKMIVRRMALSVMAAILTVLTLASFVVTYLFAPFQLTCEQALDDFYVREDGAVVIDYSSAVVGRNRSGDDNNWYLIQYSTRYDMWRGEHRDSIEDLFGTDGVISEAERQRYENIDIVQGRWISYQGKTISNAPIPEEEDWISLDGDAEKNWWYSDPTGLGNDTLLHDGGKEVPEKENRYQFSLVYPVIFFGGIVAVLLLLILRRVSATPWVKELATRFVIFCGSVVISVLFVSSGRIFTSNLGIDLQYWNWMIGTDAVFLSLAVLFWRQLYLLNKMDKAI